MVVGSLKTVITGPLVALCDGETIFVDSFEAFLFGPFDILSVGLLEALCVG